jgi:hypothetical protein
MEGGVMTTGQANGKGRRHKRHRKRHITRRDDNQAIGYGQMDARLAPGMADRLRQALIVTGSLGGASPPIDG